MQTMFACFLIDRYNFLLFKQSDIYAFIFFHLSTYFMTPGMCTL
jgi:hypothetical protein